MSWRFLTEQIRLVGADGGIFYNLVGTLILLATALMVSAPVAMGLALVEGVYLAGAARWRRRVRLAIYLLNGVPSLLFGLFGFVVFVKYLDWGQVLAHGWVAVGHDDGAHRDRGVDGTDSGIAARLRGGGGGSRVEPVADHLVGHFAPESDRLADGALF